MKKPIFIIAAAPDQLSWPEQELQKLQQLANNQAVEILPLSGATLKTLQYTISENEDNILFFHFSGHSNRDTLRFEGDYNNEIEEGKKIDSGSLANLLEQKKKPISMVFLNACESYAHVAELLAKGIKVVLATNKKVNDNTAHDVSIEFYNHFVTKNYSLRRALKKAQVGLGKMEMSTLIIDSNEISKETAVPAQWTLFINADYERLPLAGWTLTDFINDFEGKISTSLYSRELSLNIIRTKADEIVGRNQNINHIYDNFQTQKVQVINGVGGLGKSTLMQRYVDEYHNDYTHILWVDMGQNSYQSAFLEQLISANGLLEELKINSLGKKPQQIYNEVLNLLKTLPATSLLVVDNANETAFEGVDFPFSNWENWRVLIASREEIKRFVFQYKLPFLSPEEAKTLFKKHYTRNIISDSEIEELLKDLDYHTLLIEIFAKTAETKRLEMNNLRDIVKNNETVRNVKVQENRKKVDKVGDFLQALFAISNLDDYEKWLLLQLACLPYQWHKYVLLEELIQPENAGDFADALLSLANKGWISRNHTDDSYKLHTAVAMATKPSLNRNFEQVRPLYDSILEKLRGEYHTKNYKQASAWLPFGEAFINYFDELENEEIELICNISGVIATDLAMYEKAYSFIQKNINVCKTIYGISSPEIGRAYSNLAQVLHNTLLFQEAINYYEKAKEIYENHIDYGKNHIDTAILYNNLALSLLKIGENEKNKKAAELLFDYLHIKSNKYDAEDIEMAITYNNVGGLLQNMGVAYFEVVILLYKKAINIYENHKDFGDKHIDTARSYHNLSLLVFFIEDKSLGLFYSEKAYSTFLEKLNENHPYTKEAKLMLDFLKNKK